MSFSENGSVQGIEFTHYKFRHNLLYEMESKEATSSKKIGKQEQFNSFTTFFKGISDISDANDFLSLRLMIDRAKLDRSTLFESLNLK